LLPTLSQEAKDAYLKACDCMLVLLCMHVPIRLQWHSMNVVAVITCSSDCNSMIRCTSDCNSMMSSFCVCCLCAVREPTAILAASPQPHKSSHYIPQPIPPQPPPLHPKHPPRPPPPQPADPPPTHPIQDAPPPPPYHTAFA
jgi:hypothetical protein